MRIGRIYVGAIWDRRKRLALVEQLEMYVSSGLPIVTVLDMVGERLPPQQKTSLDRASAAVSSGQLLSVALAREVRLPDAVIGLITCGESSGNLAKTLSAAHSLLSREDELIKRCLSAMTYPLVIGVAAVGLTIGLVRGIMPQIIPLLTSLHTDLPLLTRMVMNISQSLTAYGAYGAAALASAVGVTVWSYRKYHRVRYVVQLVCLRIPILGGLARRYSLELFFQSFGALVESGMTADAAYAKTAASISLLPLRRVLEGHITAVGRGEPLSILFARGMPSYISPLVAAGEASGRLGGSLTRAAQILDRELDHDLKRLTGLIEPVMMIGMGFIVGSVALSIMMPIYDISKAIQK